MPRTKKTKAQPADGTPPPAAKKPKLKKPMLMDSNEFTASRRRTIRAGQRELQREIMADGQKIEDVGDSAFDDLRESNNKFFDEGVRFVREAVIDQDNLGRISVHASKQASKLIVTQNFNAQKLISKLQRKCRKKDGSICWKTLGDAVGPCFNTLPFAQFYKGPFDEPLKVKEKKIKAARLRRVDEEGEEEGPEEITQQTKRDDGISGFENVLKSVQKVLRQKTDESVRAGNKSGTVSLPEFVINPTSFTQSVENMLALAFMIKKGDASVKNDSDSLPIVNATALSSSSISARQSIVSFTMADWRDMSEAFKIEECAVPSRRVRITGRGGVSQRATNSGDGGEKATKEE